jgi:hypothetical protein
MRASAKKAAILAALCCLIAAAPVLAQSKDCKPFNAILQAKLDVSPTGLGWSGQVRGLLDNADPLFGTLTYLSVDSSMTGVAGKETNLQWKLDFGPNGAVVTQTDCGVFPIKPKVTDPFAYGAYMATAKVDPSASTGRFLNATGQFTLNGYFVVDGKSAILSGWTDLTDVGVWNAEMNGKLCGVK